MRTSSKEVNAASEATRASHAAVLYAEKKYGRDSEVYRAALTLHRCNVQRFENTLDAFVCDTTREIREAGREPSPGIVNRVMNWIAKVFD